MGCSDPLPESGEGVGLGGTPSVFSRDGSLLPSSYADTRYIDAVIVSKIPKVDPEPKANNPFDIIQPVLQYPGSTPKTWGVRSWYVTVNAGALQSTMLDTEQGDSVFCNMTRTGPESWFIGSKLNSGKETNQRVTAFHPGAAKRLKVQPWAYITLECYGCSGCDTYVKQETPSYRESARGH